MKINRFIILMLVLLSLMTACGPSYVSEAELREYVADPDKGLISRVESGSILLELVYRPKDLVKALELREIENSSERNKIIARVDTLEYFVLRLSRQGQEIENALAGNSV